MPESRPEVRDQVLDFIRTKKGQIASLAEVRQLIAAEGGDTGLPETMADEGLISISGEDVFLSSESYLPEVRCLICDGPVDRRDLVPFFREKHFPFARWGFHRGCLEDGAREEMLASGLFRFGDGGVYPNYEFGEGKNPVTVAIRFLRSEEFQYALELKSDKKD